MKSWDDFKKQTVKSWEESADIRKFLGDLVRETGFSLSGLNAFRKYLQMIPKGENAGLFMTCRKKHPRVKEPADWYPCLEGASFLKKGQRCPLCEFWNVSVPRDEYRVALRVRDLDTNEMRTIYARNDEPIVHLAYRIGEEYLTIQKGVISHTIPEDQIEKIVRQRQNLRQRGGSN